MKDYRLCYVAYISELIGALRCLCLIRSMIRNLPVAPAHKAVSHLGAEASVFAPPFAHGAAVPDADGGRRAELVPGGGGTLVLDAHGADVLSPGGGSLAVVAPGRGGGALVLDAHGARVS